MKILLSNLIILFLLTGCITKSKITYTKSIPDDCIVQTTKGVLVGDYVEVYMDSYVPRYEASPADVDNGTGESTIIDSKGRWILFVSPVDLIIFFEDRGWKYEGTGEYIVNSKMFSSWNFRRL